MGFYRQAMSQAYVSRLKQIPIFAAIKDDETAMDRIISISSLKSYGENEYIIREGEIGNELFILLKGSVEILKKTMAGDDYVVTALSAEYNIAIGELALIDDDKRSATVRTLKPTEVMAIEKASFLKLGNDFPEIGLPVTRAIAKILAGRLRKTNEDMMTLFNALIEEIK